MRKQFIVLAFAFANLGCQNQKTVSSGVDPAGLAPNSFDDITEFRVDPEVSGRAYMPFERLGVPVVVGGGLYQVARYGEKTLFVGLNGNPYFKRINVDGSPDLGFGTQGIASIRLPQVGQPYAILDVRVLRSGKVLLAVAVENGGHYLAAIVRVHSNGELDTTFGTDGVRGIPKKTSSYGPSDDKRDSGLNRNFKLLELGNGHIMVGREPTKDLNAFVVELDSNGNMFEARMCSASRLCPQLVGRTEQDSLVMGPNGNVYMVGNLEGDIFLRGKSMKEKLGGWPAIKNTIYSFRILPSGELDETYGDGGIAYFKVKNVFNVPEKDLGFVDSRFRASLQLDGKIVVIHQMVAGREGLPGDMDQLYGTYLVRLDVSGSPDQSFGLSGFAEPIKDWLRQDIQGAHDGALGAYSHPLVRPDGKIAVASLIVPYPKVGGSKKILLRVLSESGRDESTFNGGAPLVVDFTGTVDFTAHFLTLGLSQDGKILLGATGGRDEFGYFGTLLKKFYP
jgi:uncharacterized delta-60 repeat protein